MNPSRASCAEIAPLEPPIDPYTLDRVSDYNGGVDALEQANEFLRRGRTR